MNALVIMEILFTYDGTVEEQRHFGRRLLEITI